MKIKFITFFSFLIFVCANLYAQTPQKSASAKEADKLSIEVVKLFKEKKFKQAESIAYRVISIREVEFGKKHLSVAEAWQNMGYIQFQLKNNKEAEKSFDKAFEIYEENQPLSPANEKTFVEILEALAVYDMNGSSLEKAEKKYLRANDLREKTNGKDSLEIAKNLIKLGQIYRIKEDYTKAAPVLFRALEIRKQKLKIYADEVEEAYLEASCVYGKIGRKDELSQIRDEIYPSIPPDDKAIPNKINKSVVNGTAISLPKPAYPPEAGRKRIEGSVNVLVLIDESGNVIHACAFDGAKELHRSSEIAAYKAKFKPTTLSGKPVKVTGMIVYNYVM